MEDLNWNWFQIYVKRYSGNLKLGQLTRLFNLFNGSLIPSLHTFGPREGSVFKFPSLVRSGILEIFKIGLAHRPAA
jgi:hypothetical protein